MSAAMNLFADTAALCREVVTGAEAKEEMEAKGVRSVSNPRCKAAMLLISKEVQLSVSLNGLRRNIGFTRMCR